MRRLIPNLITLCNLTCGVVSIWYAQQGALTYASIAILAGIFFDFFDGMIANNFISEELLDTLDTKDKFYVFKGIIISIISQFSYKINIFTCLKINYYYFLLIDYKI